MLFRISRTVVRQAINELTYENLLYRQKGKGTYVAEPKIRESLFQNLTGFYRDMEERGYRPVSQVLKQQVVPASPKVANCLNLEPEALVIEIQRVRFVNEEPIILVTSYFPYQLCPKLLQANLTNNSLYKFIENEYGLLIVRGRRTIEAIPADEYEAQLLQVEKGAPLILLNSVSYLADGTAVEYYHAVQRGDRSSFDVELVRIRSAEKPPPGRKATHALDDVGENLPVGENRPVS